MSTQTEALKMALEALEWDYVGDKHQRKQGEAITAIKEALAQPEQEPVAWANLNALSEQINSVNCGTVYRLPSEAEGRQPLYTNPPQRTWVGLTDEEIRKAKHHMVDGAYQYSFMQGVRYAEAAHGITASKAEDSARSKT